jgi:hypothetical protein
VNQLLQKFQNWLVVRGLYIAKTQNRAFVSDLLKLIWPIETNLKLVRIGSKFKADGGYLVPDDLEGIQRLFSPGVSDNVDFESEFIKRGIPCELVDGSIDEPPTKDSLVTFKKLWLSSRTTDNSISLDDWVDSQSTPEEELLLQMDIEGSEYESILSASENTLSRFRIIVIELHDLRAVFSRRGLTLFELSMKKLLNTHVVVHAHPNNCNPPIEIDGLLWPDVLELTLIRRDRVTTIGAPARLPHHLDQDNTPNRHFALAMPGDSRKI